MRQLKLHLGKENLMKYKKIHFVGIKGVGMAPLAVIAKEAGLKVSGSDVEDVFITDEILKSKGIVPYVGFSKEHVVDSDLVITTGAHNGFKNLEVLEAKRLGIKVITQGEAVGIFMLGKIFNRKFKGISVAGTHGKTTTTAMVATILKASGKDPSFVVGTGNVLSLGSSGHYGLGKYFVAEADEYATEPNFDKTIKFMWQHPQIAVITNIEFDHPDIYSTIDDVRIAFEKFAHSLSEDAILVTCADNDEVKKLLKNFSGTAITYGFFKKNDFIIYDVESEKEILKFKLKNHEKDLGEFKLNVFGRHNALNATASIIVCLNAGLSIEEIRSSLFQFRGSKRRSEYIGKLSTGAKIFDDYAHHPTEIEKTLEGFREHFKSSKIICIFQPHTYSRTKFLLSEFAKAFGSADEVVIIDIFSSAREKKDPSISSKILASNIRKFNKNTIFLPKSSSVVEYIEQKSYGNNTILISMGAGDVYKIWKN